MHRRHLSLRFASGLLLAALVLGSSQPAHAKDLTDLSLEELMHLDVIQVTVPGAHYHFQGDWMIGVDATNVQWSGLQNGTSSVSAQQVLGNFMMAPTSATMNMQDLDLMYGYRDDWTFEVMIPQVQMAMTSVYMNGDTTTNLVSGLGDITLNVIHPFKYKYPAQWQAELGLALPTGDINQFNLVYLMFGEQKMPYNMQLGTGSFQFEPAITYLGETQKWAFGAQVRGFLPLNTNSDGWMAPNRLAATAWAAPHVNNNFSPSFRVDYQTWGNVRGNDPVIDFSMMPSSNPNLYAGSRADAYIGLNFAWGQDGEGHGKWLTFEYGVPFYQNLTGPQLTQTSTYNAAFQWTFK